MPSKPAKYVSKSGQPVMPKVATATICRCTLANLQEHNTSETWANVWCLKCYVILRGTLSRVTFFSPPMVLAQSSYTKDDRNCVKKQAKCIGNENKQDSFFIFVCVHRNTHHRVLLPKKEQERDFCEHCTQGCSSQ